MGLDCLAGGGEMGELMRSFDWTSSPLGPVESWPQSLRTAVSILLNSRYPMFLFWGPHLAKVYNDGYRPVLGALKHPAALGRPGPEVWPEIWDTIGPMVDRVVSRGESTWSDDLLLFMHRNGYPEECYFTFSYSPIREESGGVGGMFCACTETTPKVLGERRLRTLGDLAGATAEARTVEDACRLAAGVLAENPKDLPFALIYLFEDGGRRARLAAAAGIGTGEAASPEVVATDSPEDDWRLGRVLARGKVERLHNLGSRFRTLPARPWPEPPSSALVLPIGDRGQERPAGALVVGISPRRSLDADYQGFLELASGQIATAIANARSYEEERRRAEALAELDRAKTAFFSNVSHEFRTPLTLMLGPLEDLLASREMRPEEREAIAVAHRNSLRLLKLVNSLLDFSRIEAGRIQAVYEATDLGSLTADLASVFRSAIEKAGLRLAVDCPPLTEPVWVDRDLWEKVVLNLLSNAFKFTFEGEIEVALRLQGAAVELSVRDTGTGISVDQLPHVFERFHRVKGARGRTHEGTGIGLALVQELVKLHGGTIRVESALGRGSTFTVSIPQGREHLPADRIGAPRGLASSAIRAEAYVEEAARWLPEFDDLAGAGVPAVDPPLEAAASGRILLADDNADMREYVRRLLAGHYEVETAPDGEAALAAVRARLPDLVLADVMMPGLDGFELLRELRADPATAPVPVILLSARAGEESRVEGLEAGADDYLVKPFSARELMARVGTHLGMARVRRRTADRERELLAEAQAALHAAEEAGRAKDKFLAALSHELRTPLTPVLAAVSRLQDDPGLAGIRDELAMVRRNVELEARLIDDLLDLTRVARGKFELHREAVDLHQVVTHASEICCEPEVASGRLRVVLDFAPGDHRVWADGSRLTQVFWNLLSNAVKFTPGEGTITVRSRLDRGEMIVEVSDTGIGIDDAALPRIFDAFQQGEPHYGGLGLGLAISRAIVHLHGGQLTAASEGPGRGATFAVHLPLGLPETGHAGTPEPSLPNPKSKIQNRKSLDILLVEDHADTAEAMAELLRVEGHRITVARSVASALATAEKLEGGVDLVISDLGLPDGSGLDLMRELAARFGLRGIAVSGYGMEDDVRRSREAGFDRHLTKPINPQSLQAAIRDAAEKEPTG
jgi:signal transduction histidine kinase